LAKLGAFPAYRLWRRNKTRAKANGLIAYSEFMAKAHSRHLDCPVVHIPLGVDLAGRPAERPERPRKPIRFGFAGGFQIHKGFLDVLDAAGSLRNKGLPFELHIWGPGQERAASEIASRRLQNVARLRGMFAPQERWSVFSEMDVLVMATRDMEPFGRVIQEAAAVGAPAIAPDIAGISEQIRDGVDGLLYRFQDRQHLEHQMARIIDGPQLVSQLSRNLWTVVDTRAAVAELEAFYFKTLVSGGSLAASTAVRLLPKARTEI
jgi:glycosyltransferase involved in cell wall biosynthesis